MPSKDAMEYYRLEILALEAVAKCVANAFANLLSFSVKSSTKDLNSTYVETVCNTVDDYINKNLTFSLANEVTELNLKLILLSLDEHCKNHFESVWHMQWGEKIHAALYGLESFDMYSDYVERGMKIAARVASAATHRCTSSYSYQYNKSGTVDFQQLYFKDIVTKSQGFKELVLDSLPLCGQLPPLENLEVWSSSNTTDEVLRVLGNSSEKLRVLDITGSSFGISSKCIDYVLQFQNITHLHFNILGLQHYDKAKLLLHFQNLADEHHSNSTRIQSLSLRLYPEDLRLVTAFSESLTTLDITLAYDFNLSELKNLCYLTSLTLRGGYPDIHYSHFRDVIELMVPQLLTLKLQMPHVDLKHVAQYSTQLKEFVHYVSERDYSGPDELLPNYFSTSFPSVRFLHIDKLKKKDWRELPHYLKCFKKLDRLTLHVQQNADGTLIDYLMNSMKEGHFEELNFNDNVINLQGEQAVITSNKGLCLVIKANELNTVMKDIYKGMKIQELDRNFRIVSRERLFKLKTMDSG